MKRAVLCVVNPQDYIDQLCDYSIMIINPALPQARLQYLLANADWSIKITSDGYEERSGSDYPNEKLFWYTSGTTGDSKFCSFSQTQLDVMTSTICKAYNLTANDRYVSVMPLWHAHGQGFYWATRKIACQTQFIDVKNLRHMPDHCPTFITAIPDILKTLAGMKFEHLRFLRSASAPLSNQLYEFLKQHYQVPVIEAFGMTEALSHCFTNPLQGQQRMGTVGLPDGVEANIINGKLFIKGPTVFESGWYDTGDLATQDDFGYYVIQGRSRDQINVKGIKLNPLSIEQQIKNAVSDLDDCVIFGTNKVKCLYSGSCDVQTVKSFLCQLGWYCRPAMIKQVESIPTGPSGKISRTWLDQQFE